MDIDGSGAKELARRIVSHALTLEEHDLRHALLYEKLRAEHIKNDDLEENNCFFTWLRRIQLIWKCGDVLCSLVMLPVLLFGSLLSSVLFPAILFSLLNQRELIANSTAYNLVGCGFVHVVHPRLFNTTMGDYWFYLFNRTINHTTCF